MNGSNRADRLARAKDLSPGSGFWRFLLLDVFLHSVARSQAYGTFEDTLTPIGLGCGLSYLLALRPTREQWAGPFADHSGSDTKENCKTWQKMAPRGVKGLFFAKE